MSVVRREPVSHASRTVVFRGTECVVQCMVVSFSPELRLACVVFCMVWLCWLAGVGSGDSGVSTSWNQSDMHLTSGAVHRRPCVSVV